MSASFLRILSQRRQAGALTTDPPRREEIEDIVRAAAGPGDPERALTWRLIGTGRDSTPELAAVLSGLKEVPELKESAARLKGKQMRRVAAFRGSLGFASRGGLALALIFTPSKDSDLPKRFQRGEALGARSLLEVAFFASGWATQWSPRQSPDEDLLAKFYGLAEGEEVLGWLFVGRADPSCAEEHSAQLPLPPAPLELR